MHAYPPRIDQLSKFNNFINMDPIQFALEDLDAQEYPNIAETARKYGLNRSTLSRRWNGKTGSRARKVEMQSLLSNHQEKSLIKEINRLTNRGTPPTVAMVRSFAFEICGKWPGKNWATQWCKRHSNELTSLYLTGFDMSRHKADSWYQVKRYFDLVCYLPRCITIANLP